MSRDTRKRVAGPDLLAGLDALIEEIADRVAERVCKNDQQTTVERIAYGPAEIAVALGMAESTVRDRIKDGTIHAARIGDRVLVHRSELDRLLLGDEDISTSSSV